MSARLKLGRPAGIDLYLHWSFLLIIAYVIHLYRSAGQGMGSAALGVLLILIIFGCVVLHELGHALMARRFGIPTRDITLFPIGGVARLERMPERPTEELLVALAGPAVNVAIAIGLTLAIRVAGVYPPETQFEQFLVQITAVNIFLVVFNLLPAFPMDGGRALRALLAMRTGRLAATRTAASIGQAMAIVFGMVGLFITENPFHAVIAVFVYFGAAAERKMVETQATLGALRVSDAMLTRFISLAESATAQEAVKELLAGSQIDFPVVDQGRYRGLLERNTLVQTLAERTPEASMATIPLRRPEPTHPNASLTEIYDRMRREGYHSLPVLENDRLVGLLTQENVAELIMVRRALSNP